MVDVPLDEKLSPAQNAQRYFKLYQKARSAKSPGSGTDSERPARSLIIWKARWKIWKSARTSASLAELRAELEKLRLCQRQNRSRRQIKQLPPSVPMKLHLPRRTG